MANDAPNNQTHLPPAATAYAGALLDVAVEQKNEEAVGEELRQLLPALDAKSLEFLADPAIGRADRSRVLEQSFANRVSPPLMNLLRAMDKRGHFSLLPQVAEAYARLLEKHLGRVDVTVSVPQPLNDAELEQVRTRVSAALNKKAFVTQKVDESIIGGLVLRVEDQLIDASAKAQLTAMREQLLAAAPRN